MRSWAGGTRLEEADGLDATPDLAAMIDGMDPYLAAWKKRAAQQMRIALFAALAMALIAGASGFYAQGKKQIADLNADSA